MDRHLYRASLTGKRLLASPSRTYLLDFEVDEEFSYSAGQFVSVVVDSMYPEGHVKAGQPREETRAYSLADAPRGRALQLCFNVAGSFSEMLASLEMGETIRFHGPHGTFVRREGAEASLFLGAEAGIVPLRSIVRDAVPANSTVMQLAETREDLIFRDEFGSAAGLRYLPIVGADTDFVVEQVRALLLQHAEIRTAYLCGLNARVSPVRDLLKSLGWDRKQIVFERYD